MSCYIPSCTVHTCYHLVISVCICIVCICVSIRANAILMRHHCSMHVESRPSQGPSHACARQYTSLASIRHAHTTWQLFVTPPPKMSQNSRAAQLCPLGMCHACNNPWRSRNLDDDLQSHVPNTVNIAHKNCQISPCFKIQQIWGSNWHPIPKMHLGGSNYPVILS